MLRRAEDGTDREAAADLGVDEATVERWQDRSAAGRLEGLHEAPWPGRPPWILLDQIEDVIAATLETTPGRDTHRSRALTAARTGLSQLTAGRIWKKFDIKPHMHEPVKLSTDPSFAEKVDDAVELNYPRPRRRWCCAWMRSPR